MLAPWLSDVQPPDLWEVNICCLSHPLFGICYSSLSWPRHFLLFHLHNLNWPVFKSAHEPHPAIFLCSYHTWSLQNLYIFFLKEFFLMWTIFKSLLNWLCWLKKKDVQLESCELSFIWGRRRSAAHSISDSSERLLQSRLGGKSKYKFSVKGKFTEIPRSTQLTKGFFVSHEGLMSPWRDLVLL